ncbi:MAG: alpha/beta fold hydrolase [Candidatus Eiseniibacteriota bacterium]
MPCRFPEARPRAARRALLALSLVLALSSCTRKPSPLPPGGHVATLNGFHMYYEIHGQGAPLLLLHGGAGNGMQFTNQVPFFSRTREVIVPDACGQGRSGGRDRPLTYHDLAEDVIALMDHLGIQRADVMGWSDGGIEGLDLAIHHPDRIAHVAALGANFSPEGMNEPDRAWAETARAESFGPDMKRDYQRLSPEPWRFESVMNQVITLWRDQPHYTPAELRSIRVPVLVIAGEHDVVRPEHTRALAAGIPGARLWIVPGASHSVMFEQPEKVNATVSAFFEGHTISP